MREYLAGQIGKKPNRVYLAGPIRGNPNHRAEFSKYELIIRSRGYEVFNPAKESPETGDETLAFRRKVFALDTAWLCTNADIVAMMPGWESSAGARAEHALAMAVGLKVMYL